MVLAVSASLQRHALGVTWFEPSGTFRTAHALTSDGRVWLVDPFEDEAALVAAMELGALAGVLQLLDRHSRDSEALSQRFGVPLLRLPRPGQVSGTPFDSVPVISRRVWTEVALWWAAQSTLVVAEAVGTAPAFALGRRVGVHPVLRLTPPRAQLAGYPADRLLVGHGEPLESGARQAIDEALDHSRSDLPRLMLKLPSLLRGG
jgi:hypothetical protein